LTSRRVGILLAAGAAVLGATLTTSAVAAPFAAVASVSPQIQYLGDSTGATFTFTVENTGTTDSIGAVEISRPGKLWRIIDCPSALPGWSAQRSDTACRFRSEMGPADDLAPGQETSAFQVTATVPPGTQNLTGLWTVKVSRSSNFDTKSKLVAAASEPPGLGITAYSFQVLDAVVDPATSTPGAPCPTPVNKSAITGSTGHTLVICGRNRTTGTLTPTAAKSSLGGTFVAGSGSFSSGAVAPTASSVVLGTWSNVTIISLAGPGKTVIARIGSASNRTSPLTTLTGYEALNNPPTAVDDDETTDEDNPVSLDPRTNDSDPDGDPLTISDTDTTGTEGSVTITGGGTGLTYDPDGQFDHLAVGEQATDTFTYTVADTFGATDTATVTITVTGVNDDPTAVDDEKTVGENSAGASVDVLANDTDPDTSDTLEVTAVDTTGTTGLVANNGTDVTYDPNGQFNALAVGETATDTFTYDVSDGHGGTDTATVTVTITGANDAPTAVDDSGAGFTGAADSGFTTGSVLANDTDPDASDTLAVQGFDTTGTQGTVTSNGDGTFDYDPDGAFDDLPGGDTATDTFTYTVTDGNGGTDTATVTITITGANHPPNAVADEKTVGENSSGTIVDVVANDSDADGDPLIITSVDTTGTTGQVSNNGGDVTYDPAGQFEHLAVGETATDTFTYTIADVLGATDTATVTITVTGVNDDPTAVDDEKTVGENSAGASVDVLANDTDPDTSDTLEVTAVDSTGTTGLVTNNGTDVTYDPNGQFENLADGESTTDTFTYTVSDGHGGTDTATVTVTVTGANDAPNAVDDEATVGKDDPATAVDVLANDTDDDASDVLVVDSVDDTGTTGVVTNNGTDVSYDPNGQFDDLEAGDTATDTFTYTVSDGNGGTDTATVTITVSGANAPPVANDDADDVDEDSTGATIDVLANDTDANAGDTLSVTAVDDTGTTGLVSLVAGVVSYDPDGQFEHLAAGETGTDTFTYTVSDGTDTDTATVTITINGANDDPTAVDDSPAVGEDSGGTTVAVLANDTDPDTSDVLSVASIDETGTTGDVTLVGGVVTYSPDGQFNALKVGTNGTDTFTYTVSDGNGGTDVATVTVTITGANDPPNAVDDTGTTDEDTTLSQIAPGVLTNDTDPDTGDTKTVTELNGSATLTGTSIEGAAVTINADGSYSYNPGTIFQGLSTGQSDTDTFTYTMQDGSGAQDTATVTITVNGVSDAPTAVADSFNLIGNTGLFVGTTKPAGQAGKEIIGSVLTNDTDPDTPQASLVAEPVTNAPTTLGGTITIEPDGNFTYHPDDGDSGVTDTFTYRVCDASPCSSGTVANATGTLNLPISSVNQVWYVTNNQAPGDGTSDAPFDTLAEAETAAGAGDITYVFDGDNTTTNLDTGFSMAAGEQLLGERATLQVGPDVLYTGVAANRPTLTANNEDVVTLASGNTVRGLQIDPQGTGGGISSVGFFNGGTIADVQIIDTGTAGTQPGLELDGVEGTYNISDLTVDNSAATGQTAGSIGVRLNRNLLPATINFASAGTISITTKGAKGLENTGMNMGLASVFDDITVTGSSTGGVSMVNSLGSGTVFGDGSGVDLALTTTGGTAFNLQGTGTVTVPAAGTANVNATAGSGIFVNGSSGSSLAFDDVTVTSNPSGSGIVLTALGTGTFSATSGSISNVAGTAFAAGSGSGAITYPGAINNGLGRSVEIAARTGGTVTLSGNINDTADAGGGIFVTDTTGGSTVLSGTTKTLSTGLEKAVQFSNSDGHTLTISGGGLDVDTTVGTGVEATTSGTLNITGAGNTIDTTAGKALSVTDTDVGASPLTFQRISSLAGAGITLSNTGANPALTVASSGSGTCTAADQSGCTGGVIQNTGGADNGGALPTGTGIVLNNTRGVSLTRMHVHDHSNYGIRGTSVVGFTMTDSAINGVNGTSADTAFKDGSVRFEQLTGTVGLTNVAISGGYFTNLMVDNTAGILNGTFDNVDSGTINATGGDDAVQFEGIGTSTMNVVYTNSQITTASGDLFQYIGDGSGGGNLDLTGNTLTNNEPSINTGGGGVALVAGAKGAATMDVLNNTMRDSLTNALTIIKSADVAAGTNNLVATIDNNDIGVAGTANSGSFEGDGMEITTFGDGNATFTVTNNDIRQYNSSGIQFVAGSGVAGTGQLNLNISGNAIGNPGTNPLITLLQGIRVDSGVNVADTFSTCVKFGTNSITGSSDAANKDFRLVASQSTTVRQPGYVGGNTDGAAFASYAASLIGNGAQGTAVANPPATFSGTGTACP